MERPLGQIDVPDQDLYEHQFVISGSGQLTLWVDGVPQEMLAGIMAFSVERVDGGEPQHSSYGVKGAHQKLTLDYLPLGRYRVKPTIAHQGVINFASDEVVVGEDPIDFVVEYREPARWAFDFELPAEVPAPDRVIVVVKKGDEYVDTYHLPLDSGHATKDCYLEGSYTWTFKAKGCQDVVHEFDIEPDTDRTRKIRFEASP